MLRRSSWQGGTPTSSAMLCRRGEARHSRGDAQDCGSHHAVQIRSHGPCIGRGRAVQDSAGAPFMYTRSTVIRRTGRATHQTMKVASWYPSLDVACCLACAGAVVLCSVPWRRLPHQRQCYRHLPRLLPDWPLSDRAQQGHVWCVVSRCATAHMLPHFPPDFDDGSSAARLQGNMRDVQDSKRCYRHLVSLTGTACRRAADPGVPADHAGADRHHLPAPRRPRASGPVATRFAFSSSRARMLLA
jgi:hypothetical protein